MKLLGMRGATPCQEDSLQPARSPQASAVGGQWSRRQCMGPAASSLAGHIVCCLKRQGGELVVYTEKVPATPAPAGRGTNQKAMEEAAPATCLCAERTAHYFPKDTDGKLGQVSGEAVKQCWLGLDSFCLHFASC